MPPGNSNRSQEKKPATTGRKPAKRRPRRSAAPKIIMVPVDSLVPNGYNPNRMTDEEFQELRAEVRHNRQIAKPIIARQVNGKPRSSMGSIIGGQPRPKG